MAESANTVFVQLAADEGLNNVVETAKGLGITSPVEPYPSTAISGLGAGVSPLDVASAYATFAGKASTASPTPSRASIGTATVIYETVYDHEIGAERVLTGNEAAVANEVLRGVVKHGRRRCSTTSTRK
jgi:penicillin-binding protein 1A